MILISVIKVTMIVWERDMLLLQRAVETVHRLVPVKHPSQTMTMMACLLQLSTAAAVEFESSSVKFIIDI